MDRSDQASLELVHAGRPTPYAPGSCHRHTNANSEHTPTTVTEIQAAERENMQETCEAEEANSPHEPDVPLIGARAPCLPTCGTCCGPNWRKMEWRSPLSLTGPTKSAPCAQQDAGVRQNVRLPTWKWNALCPTTPCKSQPISLSAAAASPASTARDLSYSSSLLSPC